MARQFIWSLALLIGALFFLSKAHAGVDIWTVSNGGGAATCAGSGYPPGEHEGVTPAAAVGARVSAYNTYCVGGTPPRDPYAYSLGACGSIPVGAASASVSCAVTNVPSGGGSSANLIASITCSGTKVLNDAGACVEPLPVECPARGTVLNSGWYEMGTNPNASFPAGACVAGCDVSFSGQAPAGQRIINGVMTYYAKGTYEYAGGEPNESCTTPPADNIGSILPDHSCGPNQSGGTVNGKWVCLDKITGEPTPTKPPKETTKTESKSTDPVTGNTTTQTTVHHPGGGTTTTTQTRDAEGNLIEEKIVYEEGPNEEGEWQASSGEQPDANRSWWDPVYPEGISPVWAAFKGNIEATAIGSALNNMGLPSMTGSLPTWEFNMSALGLGTHSLQVPEWIWLVIKAIFLVSAAFYCRRIVFGG